MALSCQPVVGACFLNRTSIATRLRERLQKSHPEVMAAYLFGSVARGEARRSSDIDLAVLYRAAPSPTLEGLGISLQLQDVLEEELGADPEEETENLQF